MQHNLIPFLNLDESVLKEMIPKVWCDVPQGQHHRSCRRSSDSLYVILSGRVKVYISDEDGKEFILSTISPGDYFGEVALDGGPRTASIMTQEACRFFVIPKADVKELIEHHPDFARDLIGRLIRKIRNMADSVHNLALLSVYCRLLKFIEEQATQREDGRLATERLTQQEIAARIGSSREMVSRIITDLTTAATSPLKTGDHRAQGASGALRPTWTLSLPGSSSNVNKSQCGCAIRHGYEDAKCVNSVSIRLGCKACFRAAQHGHISFITFGVRP